MANVLINENSMTAIADAIRAKNGTQNTYKPAQMADAISAISGGITPTGTKSITANGTYDVTAFASAEVNVPTGGGGSNNLEIGSFTLSSDLTLTTSPQVVPNLQLGFMPDFLLIEPDRTSFEAIESPAGGLWAFMALKKAWCAPLSVSASATPETDEGDYAFAVTTGLLDNSVSPNGKGLWGTPSVLGMAFYQNYAINNDGTISVGRYSNAASKMYAAKYNYIAVKF